VVTEQRHRIRRQVLELHAPDEDSARRVQSELSRIQRQQLESIIEQCCSELSAPDRVHRIDLLEIDLGTVDFGRLESELPKKLKSVMRKALARQIEQQDTEARRRDRAPAVTSQLELLAFFAATGTLPWWADYANPRLIPDTLGSLLDHAPDRLADLLRTIVRERSQGLRLVLHSDDATMFGLLRAVMAASPSSASSLRQQTEAILTTWSHLPGANIAPIRNLFWLSLVRQAAADAASAPSESFWQQVFGEIQMQSHDAYVSLVIGMQRAARSSRDKASAQLAPLLCVLFADRRSRAFVKLPAEVQVELAQFLGERATKATEPPTGEQAYAPTDRSGTIESSGGTDKLESSDVSETRDSLSEAPRPDTANRAHLHLRQAELLDLDFGDADTVYIENSGLVLLWPFLPRFLERLHLVEDGKFKDSPAQHRAVGLLQHLVTEDPSPPEYQTTLNKVLCGLDPAALLEFGPPVTEIETEECATLLSSVIAQAPILHDMSIAGFRGSFLLRKGLLSARDGVWLLRVERETYDVVLDRFPWSVNWVRFPWMEVPLGVEW